MDGYIKKFLLFFTTTQCYEEYFLNYNFFDGDCFKISLSKTLGTLIILGSVTVKVPQILKIIQDGNAEGINLLGVILDLFVITSSFAYAFVKDFPFSAWGEAFFLAIQTAIIAILILHYTNRQFHAGVFIVTYAAFVSLLLTEMIPANVLWSLQIFNIPIVTCAKGLQALNNFQNKSTGRLSFTTCWMQFAGTTVRIFTSIQETGDFTFVMSYVICSILNGIVAFQFLIYKNNPESTRKQKSE